MSFFPLDSSACWTRRLTGYDAIAFGFPTIFIQLPGRFFPHLSPFSSEVFPQQSSSPSPPPATSITRLPSNSLVYPLLILCFFFFLVLPMAPPLKRLSVRGLCGTPRFFYPAPVLDASDSFAHALVWIFPSCALLLPPMREFSRSVPALPAFLRFKCQHPLGDSCWRRFFPAVSFVRSFPTPAGKTPPSLLARLLLLPFDPLLFSRHYPTSAS